MDYFKENSQSKYLPTQLKSDKNLIEIIAVLRKELSPINIYFYGSRANLTNHQESDYDFVVITPNSDTPSYEQSRKAKKALKSLDVQSDIFVYSQDEFNEWKDEFSSILETALNTGYEVSHL